MQATCMQSAFVWCESPQPRKAYSTSEGAV